MNLKQAILRDADRCVLCGICLPHCPTYVQSGNEAESPRGRISLMLALARGQLAATPALQRHLDSCLACRTCETKCPSEVHYGRLIATARQLIATQRRAPLRARLLVAVTSRAAWLARLVALGRSRIGNAVVRGLKLRPIEALLATPNRSVTSAAEPATPVRGRVALFVGCTGDAFNAETVAAAQLLLQAAGFAVEIPAAQECCGALHHQLGDRHGFETRARANLAAFAPFDTVVFIATGCGAMLHDYGTWLSDSAAAAFASRCVELTDFLARHGFPESIRFRADHAIVAVHAPCTQTNVLKLHHSAERLLAHIPALRLHPLPDNATCCGAAGSHMLTHTAMAEALREPKITALARSGARYLVTTNVGCALHLAAGAQLRGLDVEVLHPAALLARHLVAASAQSD